MLVVEDTSTTGGSALTAVQPSKRRAATWWCGHRGGPRNRCRRGHPGRRAPLPERAGPCRSGAGLGGLAYSARRNRVGRLPGGLFEFQPLRAPVRRPGRPARRIAGAARLEYLGVEPALGWRLCAHRCLGKRRLPDRSECGACQIRGHSLRALRCAGTPVEATGLGSCDAAMATVHDITSPLSAPPDRLTGAVCLGPLKDRSQVRGVYGYSPRDRITNSSAAYPVAFPLGLLPTNANDTGPGRQDRQPVGLARRRGPGDQGAARRRRAFLGNGYMLLGLQPARSPPGIATSPRAAVVR